MNIKDLKPGMSGLDIQGKLVEKYDPVVIRDRKYAFTVLEDDTEKIKLNLWGNQVDQAKVGDVICLPKAFTHAKRGRFQLSTWADTIVLKSK